jgi:hypothetical protein
MHTVLPIASCLFEKTAATVPAWLNPGLSARQFISAPFGRSILEYGAVLVHGFRIRIERLHKKKMAVLQCLKVA